MAYKMAVVLLEFLVSSGLMNHGNWTFPSPLESRMDEKGPS